MKKVGIAVGVLAVIGIGVGIYFYSKKKSSSAPRDFSEIMATSKDFDDLIDSVKRSGSDILNEPESKLKKFKENYVKFFTKKESDEFKKILLKQRAIWNPSEKLKFSELYSKLVG